MTYNNTMPLAPHNLRSALVMLLFVAAANPQLVQEGRSHAAALYC
jgi:hypothetical protein